MQPNEPSDDPADSENQGGEQEKLSEVASGQVSPAAPTAAVIGHLIGTLVFGSIGAVVMGVAGSFLGIFSKKTADTMIDIVKSVEEDKKPKS